MPNLKDGFVSTDKWLLVDERKFNVQSMPFGAQYGFNSMGRLLRKEDVRPSRPKNLIIAISSKPYSLGRVTGDSEMW